MSAIYCPITKRPFNHQAGRNTRLRSYLNVGKMAAYI